MKSKLLSADNDWTDAKLTRAWHEIEIIAHDELHLDLYPNQIEIVDSSQMLELYASNGLPMMYNHWSFGKHFIQHEYSYRKGHSSLAYELIINSSPAISYLMAENSFAMQCLVLAHACAGHNHFFKNNYLFKQWTDADGILDYLQFAKKYITQCEEKFGSKAVEDTLDACHSIMDYGVDRYSRPSKPNKKKEQDMQEEREKYVQQQANELWRTLPNKKKKVKEEEIIFPKEPQENIMYFIEKFSPSLESWQRELMRIVRKIAQYFYPQRQTKLMNEGWATFTHYYIMNRLWDKGMISDGNMLEFIHSHAGVLTQLPYSHKHYGGFNPYAIGFDMFSDIRRVCSEPTKEDREFFPEIAGAPWLDVCLDAVRNYRDESFISQFLSPALIRKRRLFEVTNNQADGFVTISGIQDARGYDSVRQTLSRQYSISRYQPDLQVVNASLTSSRELKIKYTANNTEELDYNKTRILEYLKFLWGYQVSIIT